MNIAAPHYLLNRTAITPIEFDYERCIADFSLNQLADLPAELGTTFANFVARLKDQCPTIAAEFEAKLVASMRNGVQLFLVEFPHLTNNGFSWYQIIGEAFGECDQRKIRLTLVDISAQRFCEVNERIANVVNSIQDLQTPNY